MRFCESCHALLGERSRRCSACGAPVAGIGGRFEALSKLMRREAQDPAAEFARAHLHLVKTAFKKAASLQRAAGKLQERALALQTSPLEEVQRDMAQVADELLELEQGLEELKREYNRQSDGIEEASTAQIGELEADLDLPVELQASVQQKFSLFSRCLAVIEQALEETGRSLALGRGRLHSRFLGLPAKGEGARSLKALLILVAGGLGAWWGVFSGVSPGNAARVLGPLAAALLLIRLASRS